MKKLELKEVLPDFGYQFLDQITIDIQRILLEVKNKDKNISLSCFIKTLDEELERRDQLKEKQ